MAIRLTLCVIAVTAACSSDEKPSSRAPTEDVMIAVGDRSVPGTIAKPASAGKHAGAVLLAGSGPTDRNWESPLLSGSNGSGRLVAERLAAAGVVVLRFDKAGSGKNPPPAGMTFDTYLDEGRAALAVLRARPDVDPAKLFVLGHSEGGIHAIRLALADPAGIVGVGFLSSAGRSMAEIIVGQLEAQLRAATPATVDQQIATIRDGLARFVAGETVDGTTLSPLPPVQQLLVQLTHPAAAAITRPLIAYDPGIEIAKLRVPVFVFNGGKDVQIDPVLDAKRLADAARAAGLDVTLHVSPDADHVLKHQPKTLAALRADPMATQNGYNAADRDLDPDFARALVAWITR
jgi:pimeloyl-ACP methyl ester carboxylesterase